MKRLITLGVALVLSVSLTCCFDGPVEPPPPEDIRVMTYNIYVGADLMPILTESVPDSIPLRVLEAFLAMQSTQYPERAKRIADEIISGEPHLVGLQEVSIVHLQSPGDWPLPVPADTEFVDFMKVLLAELERRNAPYSVAGTSVGYDIEMPMIVGIDPIALDDIRLTDSEAILVRDGVQVGNIVEGHYAINLEAPMPIGPPIVLSMGWVSAEAIVNEMEFRFVSTHLETEENSPLVQEAQVAELLEVLSSETLPIVLVGDFNSAASSSIADTYNMVMNAGFTDAWLAGSGSGTGYTCCQTADLLQADNLNRRIDYIFLKGGFEVRSIKRVGANQEDRTLTGLWPSDHAGLLAKVRLP